MVTKRTKRRDSILVEDEPKFRVGKFLKFKSGERKEILKIYSKELQDLTLGELEKMGYNNPRSFIDDRIKTKGSFKSDKVIWIIEFKVERR